MRKLLLPAAAFMAIIAVSCNNNSGSESMPSNATQADSLSFYLGQLDGVRFKNEGMQDSTMATESAKKAYLEGLKTGLGLPRQEDQAYNMGLMQGMQMAGSFQSFNKEYGGNMSTSVYLSAVTGAIYSDSTIDQRKAQMGVQEIVSTIRAQKEEKEHQAAIESLSSEAASKGLPKISDDLYGKVTVVNDSTPIKEGDLIKLDITAVRPDGQSVPVNFPARGKVGARNMHEVITTAVKEMRSGETGEFMTTAIGLLGGRYSQYGLEANQVINLTITPSIEPEKKD